MSQTPMLTSALVLLAVLAGAAPAWAQEPDAGDPSRPATSQPDEGADRSATSRVGTTVRHLVEDTLGALTRDPGRLLSEPHGWLLVAGAAASFVSAGYEAAGDAHDRGPRLLVPGHVIGGTMVQGGGAVALYLIGRSSGDPRVSALGRDLVRAQALTGALTWSFKLGVDRTRPNGFGHAFPSGHTSSTFATATVLSRHFGWRVAVPVYGVATYVAAERVQSHRHYLSDTIFGAVLGVVGGRTVTVGRGSRRFQLEPVALPHGVGLTIGPAGSPRPDR